jgi:hypothetical protein
MVMGRFLIDIYPISLFTSIREEQGLNMEAVYPVKKRLVLDKLILYDNESCTILKRWQICDT